MWLITGLGNPGSEYAATRHNIGFMAIDRLARAANVSSFSSKFQGEVASVEYGGEKLILLKPQTYMNLSGKSVQAAMAFYKLPPAQLVVIHDELDLPLGKVRIKKGGGANGHNGIKDIDAMIGPDYYRARLGIGHPGEVERVHGHVLSRFTGEEQAMVEKVNQAFVEHLPLLWTHSPDALGSRIATTLNPPAPKPKKEENISDLK